MTEIDNTKRNEKVYIVDYYLSLGCLGVEALSLGLGTFSFSRPTPEKFETIVTNFFKNNR